MVKMKEIADLSKRIARDFRPRMIVLFGSHARGRAGGHSDVDLLVVMPFRGRGISKSLEILNKVKPHFGVDLLVRTPAQVRKRLLWNDFFLSDVMKRGRILYAAPYT